MSFPYVERFVHNMSEWVAANVVDQTALWAELKYQCKCIIVDLCLGSIALSHRPAGKRSVNKPTSSMGDAARTRKALLASDGLAGFPKAAKLHSMLPELLPCD